jgi:hypothetical protein
MQLGTRDGELRDACPDQCGAAVGDFLLQIPHVGLVGGQAYYRVGGFEAAWGWRTGLLREDGSARSWLLVLPAGSHRPLEGGALRPLGLAVISIRSVQKLGTGLPSLVRRCFIRRTYPGGGSGRAPFPITRLVLPLRRAALSPSHPPVTYDWRPTAPRNLTTGGSPVVVPPAAVTMAAAIEDFIEAAEQGRAVNRSGRTLRAERRPLAARALIA